MKHVVKNAVVQCSSCCAGWQMAVERWPVMGLLLFSCPAADAPLHCPYPACQCPQACLCWWSVISPFSGYGSTAALVFVLAVAAVKAIWEDVKRHHEDKRMNTSVTHRVNADGARLGWSRGCGRRRLAGGAVVLSVGGAAAACLPV